MTLSQVVNFQNCISIHAFLKILIFQIDSSTISQLSLNRNILGSLVYSMRFSELEISQSFCAKDQK